MSISLYWKLNYARICGNAKEMVGSSWLNWNDMLTTMVNAVLEQLDKETKGMGTTDYNYDLIR